MLELWQFMVLLGVPSAFMGFCVWLLKKHLDKKDIEHQRKEDARKRLDYAWVTSLSTLSHRTRSTATYR